MRFSTIAAATLMAVGVSAGKNGTVVTEVLTEYETYCPEPTTLTHGGKTYTITEATTVTLPCPTGCTVTKPISSAVVTKCTTCTAKPPPPPPTSKPYGNATTPAPTKSSPSVAPPAKTSAPPAFTGAANHMAVSGGALAAVFGLAAYIL